MTSRSSRARSTGSIGSGPRLESRASSGRRSTRRWTRSCPAGHPIADRAEMVKGSARCPTWATSRSSGTSSARRRGRSAISFAWSNERGRGVGSLWLTQRSTRPWGPAVMGASNAWTPVGGGSICAAVPSAATSGVAIPRLHNMRAVTPEGRAIGSSGASNLARTGTTTTSRTGWLRAHRSPRPNTTRSPSRRPGRRGRCRTTGSNTSTSPQRKPVGRAREPRRWGSASAARRGRRRRCGRWPIRCSRPDAVGSGCRG